MEKFVKRIFLFVVLVIVTAMALDLGFYLIHRQSQLAELQREKKELEAVITRLTGRTRRAEMAVYGQQIDGRGRVLNTTLIWREYTIGPDGDDAPLPMKLITVPGNIPHVDAIVLKFQDQFVEENDVLRGKSLAIFRRLYGDTQAPTDGNYLTAPGDVPDALRCRTGAVTTLERSLWSHIWDLMSNTKLAKDEGLDVVQGEDVYKPVTPGKLYVIYLQNDGGLEFTERDDESAVVDDMLHSADKANSTVAPPDDGSQ